MRIWLTLTAVLASTSIPWSPAEAQEGPGSRRFRRGDANADGRTDLSDAVRTFNWLFSDAEPPSCLDAADSNDDGRANISDGIFTLSALFSGGAPIPPPGHERCGEDPTPDELSCTAYEPCERRCGGIAGFPCDEGQVCDLPAGLCSSADLFGECVDVPDGCPEIFDPVCGCDGVTYSNDCERLRAGVQKDRDGPCATICGGFAGFPCDEGQVCDLPPGFCSGADLAGECVDRPEVCVAVFDPVCGCDGVTYSNDCERLRAGVQKDHDGACENICGGFAGLPCDRGQICDLPPGLCEAADLLGECVDVPRGCPDVFDPVCGCDGVTYSNDCERLLAGVQKDRDGPCRSVCGGFLGIPCDDGQVCDLPPGLCETADLPGECVDRPEACPRNFDPVCGCDGVTYANDCERLRAGVQSARAGACPE